MKIFLFTAVSVFLNSLPSLSQEQADLEVMEKFIITDATHNGLDITPQLLEEEAFLSFYQESNKDVLYFANVWPNARTLSYGSIYAAEYEELEETDEYYQRSVFSFNWKYQNSYDHKTGTARVQVLKAFKPQGIYFEITIVPEDLDILIYKGFVKGTLDLTVYD